MQFAERRNVATNTTFNLHLPKPNAKTRRAISAARRGKVKSAKNSKSLLKQMRKKG